MSKYLCILFAGAMISLYGSVLHKWSVETSEISEESITAYRGETIEMQCQMLSYGKVVSGCGRAEFLWQTNGMGSAWWTTNAVASSGYVKFNWTPWYDSGAGSYRFFFRVTDAKGANYRANGSISFLDSPTGDVTVLPIPSKILDFALVDVVNPTNSPFVIKGGSGGVDAAAATNIAEYVVATNGFAHSSITNGLASTNYVNEAVGRATPGDYYNVSNKAYFAVAELGSSTNRWNAKQDAIDDYTTTGAVKQIVASEGYMKTADATSAFQPKGTYQWKLPYSTNAIPAGVIANPPWLTSHQSLAWSNDYLRVDGKVNWASVTNHADFVTESVTNGLASTNYVNAAVENCYEKVDGITIGASGTKLISTMSDDGTEIKSAQFAPGGFTIVSDDEYSYAQAIYFPGRISYINQRGMLNPYNLSFPSSSGTLALTSDIPSYFAPYATNATAKIQASDIASGVIPTVPANIVTYSSGDPQTSSAILSSANATAESKLTNVAADTFSTTNHDSIAYKAAAVVADQQWSSPGAWTASYVMIPSTEDHSGANSYTNWNWMIYSNYVASITYGYTAKCYQEVLDLITANASPIVRWEALNGGSFSNDYFSVTNAGMYRVRAHAADGTVDSMDIPMFPQKKESKTQDIYIADATNGWRKSVNDTAKTLLLAATTNGTGTIEGKTYNKFITFTAPFAPTGSGRLYPWIVSPHVVASAWHYGGSVGRGWYTLTYNGQTSTVYRLNWYKLDEWAMTHGWSREEVNAMNISDIYLCQCNNGAFPSEWCPKFMSDAKRTEYFAGDMKCVQGWSVNQDSPYAIPLTFDSNTRWQPVKTSASIISRADIKPILEAMAPCAWGYGGDSGKPIFIKHGADFVIVSAFYSAISGPDYSKGFEVLKAFCAFCGDTIKEVE